jgi:hypothetical protein
MATNSQLSLRLGIFSAILQEPLDKFNGINKSVWTSFWHPGHVEVALRANWNTFWRRTGLKHNRLRRSADPDGGPERAQPPGSNPSPPLNKWRVYAFQTKASRSTSCAHVGLTSRCFIKARLPSTGARKDESELWPTINRIILCHLGKVRGAAVSSRGSSLQLSGIAFLILT